MGFVLEKINKYAKTIDIFSLERGVHFHLWNFLRKQIRSTSRYRNFGWIRNCEKIFLNAEDSIQFFIDYHNHSKDTVQIIKDGYGITSYTLGRYDGYMIVHAPEESKIPDIGSARSHLRDGYPDLWELKLGAEYECGQKIKEVENLINEIKSRVSSELERKIKTTDTKLVIKSVLFSSQREYPVSCYYDYTIQEIVNEIKMRSDGKIHENLSKHIEYVRGSSVERRDLAMYKISFGENGKRLCELRENDYDEIHSRIEKLLIDSDLKNKISELSKLKSELDANPKRNKFFVEIDKLYRDVTYETKSLNMSGKCGLCPFKE